MVQAHQLQKHLQKVIGSPEEVAAHLIRLDAHLKSGLRGLAGLAGLAGVAGPAEVVELFEVPLPWGEAAEMGLSNAQYRFGQKEDCSLVGTAPRRRLG